jgi:hypothetical protein
MSEVLIEIEAVVNGPDNKLWVPRLCGAVRDGRVWDGWFEFTPVETMALPVRTVPVTEQPTRDAVLEWAGAVTYEDLADALWRSIGREARSG